MSIEILGAGESELRELTPDQIAYLNDFDLFEGLSDGKGSAVSLIEGKVKTLLDNGTISDQEYRFARSIDIKSQEIVDCPELVVRAINEILSAGIGRGEARSYVIETRKYTALNSLENEKNI